MAVAPRRRAGRWLAALVVSAVLAACSSGRETAAPPAGARLSVVAGLFPLAEVARWVGGSRITLTDLTPAGAEPEDLRLGPGPLAAIRDAGVVIDIGGGFQPALEAAAAAERDTVSVLPAIGGGDPHIWLDPVLMQQVATVVARTFERADPAGTTTYQRGARDLIAALGALDISYRTSLAGCGRQDLVTTRDAFGRLTARYGLTAAAVTGDPPAGRPDPMRLAQLAKLIRAKGLTTVFTDPLLGPGSPAGAAAGTLARETRAKTEVLDPIESLSATEPTRDPTYLSLMTDNLDKLRSALACPSED